MLLTGGFPSVPFVGLTNGLSQVTSAVTSTAVDFAFSHFDGVINNIGSRISLGVLPVSWERTLFSAAVRTMPWPRVELFSVEDRKIVGRLDTVPIRIYRPTSDPVLPVILYFHGGGFRVGTINDFDGVCRNLAKRSGAAVISVDYRLEPEFIAPAAHDDAYFALKYIRRHPEEMGIDPARIVLAGDSAGGHIAVVLGMMSRDKNGPPIRRIIPINALLDIADFETPSVLANNGFPLNRSMMEYIRAEYVPDKLKWAEPYSSPVRGDLRGMPPMTVIGAKKDPLFGQSLWLIARLCQSGVPAEFYIADAFHDFFAVHMKESVRVMTLIAEAAKAALAP